MGNRRPRINELCRGLQGEEGAGSSSDIRSDEPGAYGVGAGSGPGPTQTVCSQVCKMGRKRRGEFGGRNLHTVCNAFMNWVFNNLHYQFNTLNTNYLAHMLC